MTKFLKISEIEKIKTIENYDKVSCAIAIVSEFWDVHACAITKDNMPVGVALASSTLEAKLKAIDCNPVEAIGGVIAFSQEIDEITAKSLYRMDFDIIIAPKINSSAVKYLEKSTSDIIELDVRLDVYKKLLMESESTDLTPKGFKVATKLKPTQEQVEDMVFAWKILKTMKKDGVIIAKDFKTRSIELGTSAEIIEKSMDNACDGSKESVLAISTNINDKKQLHPAIQGRVTAIIEPKSIDKSDKNILKVAEKYGITIISVGENE